MPIEATPACLPAVTDTKCENQPIAKPKRPLYYGQDVLSRERAIVRRSGQKFTIEWVMRDPDGFPVDLVSCGVPCEGLPPCATPSSSDSSSQSSSSQSTALVSSSSSESSGSSVSEECAPAGCNKIMLRFREVLNFSDSCRSYQACGVDIDACAGKVQFEVDITNIYPGVYWMEAAIVDAVSETPVFSNVFKMILDRSLWGVNPGGQLELGPPSLQEIRLHLRDSSAEESLLLDNRKFDDAEIALALQRPLEYWNEISPNVGPHMTTSNFPFRFHWLDGVAANLFWMVEEQFRANNLSYSAAGVQVNDQDKEQNYARAAERRWASWKEFVRRKKAEINLNQCYGGIGSTYGYAAWGGYLGYTYGY